MMSRPTYSRTYGRRSNSSATNIQFFDKVFKDNKNRPCPTKSAGVLGKWGKASFTSIRSVNASKTIDPLYKRLKLDKAIQPKVEPEDQEVFDFNDGEEEPSKGQLVKKEEAAPKPKARKFFKSRARAANTVVKQEEKKNEPFKYERWTETISHAGAIGMEPYLNTRQVPEWRLVRTIGTRSIDEPDSPKLDAKSDAHDSSSNGSRSDIPCSTELFSNESTVCESSFLNEPVEADVEMKQQEFLEENISLDERTSEHNLTSPMLNVDSPNFGTTRTQSPVYLQVVQREGVKLKLKRYHKDEALQEESNEELSEEEQNLLFEDPDSPDEKYAVRSESDIILCDPSTQESQRSLSTKNEELSSVKEELSSVKEALSPVRIEPDLQLDSDETLPSSRPILSDLSAPEVQSSISKILDTASDVNVGTASQANMVIELTDDAQDQDILDEKLQTEAATALTDVDCSVKKFDLFLNKLLDPGKKPQTPPWDMGEASDHAAELLHDWDFEDDAKDIADLTRQDTVETNSTLESGPSFEANEDSHQSPVKQRSIFKSKRIFGGEKKRALYKHSWHSNNEEDKSSKLTPKKTEAGPNPALSSFEEDFEPAALTRVTTWPTGRKTLMDSREPITSVKCSKKAKEYFTVVHNVKKAHQMQESGEFQEFNDDIEYLLDALNRDKRMVMRCLSALTLATKCMVPAFRMHLRAHGTVIKFFNALNDAPSDPNLSLCTATVMFVLSQDRLNMDLDRDSLDLMLQLLNVEKTMAAGDGLEKGDLLKNQQKVRELCEAMQKKGHAVTLNLENTTAGHLAMETLLSLTSKRAGEWFKEELRELGGLDHIVNTVRDCLSYIRFDRPSWTPIMLEKLSKADRCFRVLENVTHQNETNQIYLLESNGVVELLLELWKICDGELPLYACDAAEKGSTAASLAEALFTCLKLLINLTHDYPSQNSGSKLIGSKKEAMAICLHCLLVIPKMIPEEKRFDVQVLALCVLINLVEHTKANRDLLMSSNAPDNPDLEFEETQLAFKTLVQLFFEKEESARVQEAKTDAILDGKPGGQEEERKDPESQEEKEQKSAEEIMEETVAKLLSKAGKHMEDTLIASNIALLVGYTITDNEAYERDFLEILPNKSYQPMIDVLKKLFDFMKLTVSAVLTARIKATEKVLKLLRKVEEKWKGKLADEAQGKSSCMEGE